MKRLAIAFTLAMLLCGAGVVTSGAQGQSQDHGQGNQGLGGPPPVAEPPMSGIQWARGAAGPGGGGSPLLVYHNGPIMAAGAYVEPIFWGPRWNDNSFAADKMTGIHSFYEGLSTSAYEANMYGPDEMTCCFCFAPWSFASGTGADCGVMAR